MSIRAEGLSIKDAVEATITELAPNAYQLVLDLRDCADLLESSLRIASEDSELKTLALTGARIRATRLLDSLSGLLHSDLFHSEGEIPDSGSKVLQREIGLLGVGVADGGLGVGGSLLGVIHGRPIHDASPSGSGQVLVTPDSPTRTVGERSDTRSPSGGVSAPGGEPLGRSQNQHPPGL